MRTYVNGLLRTMLVVILLHTNSVFGQPGLKGNYSSNRYVHWIFNHKTSKDDQFDSPKGMHMNIRFDGNQIRLTDEKSLKVQTFIILSVSTDREQKPQQQNYTYKLKDEKSHSVTLFAEVKANPKQFSFDIFKGTGERIIYANNSELGQYKRLK